MRPVSDRETAGMKIVEKKSSQPKRVVLSYPFTETTPHAPDGAPVRIFPHARIARGDMSDSSVVSFWNHSGTHVDGPAHILKDAPPLCSFGIDQFIYNR